MPAKKSSRQTSKKTVKKTGVESCGEKKTSKKEKGASPKVSERKRHRSSDVIVPFPASLPTGKEKPAPPSDRVLDSRHKALELIKQLPGRYGTQIAECLRLYGPAVAEPLVGQLAKRAKNPIWKAVLIGLHRVLKTL